VVEIVTTLLVDVLSQHLVYSNWRLPKKLCHNSNFLAENPTLNPPKTKQCYSWIFGGFSPVLSERSDWHYIQHYQRINSIFIEFCDRVGGIPASYSRNAAYISWSRGQPGRNFSCFSPVPLKIRIIYKIRLQPFTFVFFVIHYSLFIP
jgi:hypothetical protein